MHVYFLYAIYNGVSRMQLTVYLEGWKESKEGEGWKGDGRVLAVLKMRNALFKKINSMWQAVICCY